MISTRNFDRFESRTTRFLGFQNTSVIRRYSESWKNSIIIFLLFFRLLFITFENADRLFFFAFIVRKYDSDGRAETTGANRRVDPSAFHGSFPMRRAPLDGRRPEVYAGDINHFVPSYVPPKLSPTQTYCLLSGTLPRKYTTVKYTRRGRM